MANIINNLDGTFIATVVSQDQLTRELEVYIPKLMPGISEQQKNNLKIRTNLGNNNIKIKYNENIELGSTFLAKAKDLDEPLPKTGSKVEIKFLEGNIRWAYWDKFNPNGDYNVIDEEKYEFLYSLQIADISSDIYEKDNIEIELPEGFSVIKEQNLIDPDNKLKKFKISQDQELKNRVNEIENNLGTPEKVINVLDDDDRAETKIQPASGLFKSVRNIDNRLKELSNTVGEETIEWEYKQITDSAEACYVPSYTYFVKYEGEYIELTLNDKGTLSERNEFLLDIFNDGYDLYKGVKRKKERSGIFSLIDLAREEVHAKTDALHERIKDLETLIETQNAIINDLKNRISKLENPITEE